MSYCHLSQGRSKAQYNPFEHPPNLSKAVKHYRSTLVGVSIVSSTSHICECCYKIIDKHRLELTCSYTDLGFLSISIALYFLVIKLTVLLLAIVLLPPILLYFIKLDTASGGVPIWDGVLTVFVKDKQIARWLLLGQAAITIIGIYVINRICLSSVTQIQIQAPSPQHYALKLLNLPPCTQEQVKIWIFNKFGEYPRSVIFAYDTKQLSEAFSKREDLTIKLNRLLLVRPSPIASPITVTLLAEENDRKKIELEKQIEQQDEILNKYTRCFSILPYNFIGVAFVIFDHAEKCREILKENQDSLFQRICPGWRIRVKTKYKESQIELRLAPNPKDLIWSNLKTGQYKIMVTYSVLFVGVNWLLGPTFIHLILLIDQLWPSLLLAMCLLFYLLYHLLVHLFVTFFLNKLQCSTYTRRALISFYSYGIFNVFFPIMMPYSLGLSEKEVVEFIHALLLVDSVTHSALKIFNVANVYSRIYCEYINHLPANRNPYTQGYFNRFMEGWSFKIGQNYHYLFRGICLYAFFARAAPLSAIFYIISFTIQFWIQKYILVRKCKIPPKISQAPSDHFLILLHFLPLIFLIGAYTFNSHFQQQQLIVTEFEIIIVLSISLCLLALRQHTQTKYIRKRTYKEMENLFTQFYQVENDINRYNGELKYKFKALVLRQAAQQMPDLNVQDFFVEQQEIQSQKTIQKQRHSLVNRMLSYSNEMYSFHSSASIGKQPDKS